MTDEQRHFTKEKKTTQKITFHHIRNSNAFNTHLSAHCVLAVSPRVQKQRGNRAPAIHSSGTHRTLNGESARKTIKEVKRLEVTRLEVTGRVFLDHQGSWVSTSDTWMKSSQSHKGLGRQRRGCGAWRTAGGERASVAGVSLTVWGTKMKRSVSRGRQWKVLSLGIIFVFKKDS